jgi:hypothetical protein
LSSLIIAGDTSGTITLNAPAVSGTTTLTLPTTTSTLAINGPTFSTYSNVGQTLSNGTSTKIQYNVENWDTNSNYDPSTNYRFTPTVAGYYQINASTRISGSTASGGAETFLAIYKNGSIFRRGTNWYGFTSTYMTVACSSLVYCNGSTDYIEIYVYNNTGSSSTVSNNETITYFDGAFVRSA